MVLFIIYLLPFVWSFTSHSMDKCLLPIIQERTCTEHANSLEAADFTQNVKWFGHEDTLFELSFEKGDVSYAHCFLKCGFSLNKIYKDGYKCSCRYTCPRPGRAPLIAAVENGHLEVVKLLLAKGANPNGVQCDEWPYCRHPGVPGSYFRCKNYQALSVAVHKGNIPMVRALKAAGATNFSTVSVAVETDNVEMVSTLFDMGFKGNDWQDVKTAQKKGNVPVLKLLLEHTSPTDWPSQDYDSFNYASLVVDSILNNTPDITLILLDQRPDFDVNFVSWSFNWNVSKPQTRPIIAAIQKNNPKMVKELIKRGAWLNPGIEYGTIDLNPLYAAANADNIIMVEFLLQQGASPDILAHHYNSSKTKTVLYFVKKLQSLCSVVKQPNLAKIIEMLEEHSKASTP